MTLAGRALRALLSAPIVAYQRYISPALGPRCRYAPSCSTYALQAIRVHGPIKGLILATWRLLRCNPWSHGGVDHVPERGRLTHGFLPKIGLDTITGNVPPPWDWTRSTT